MKLYDISHAIEEILASVDPETGEFPPGGEDSLFNLEGSLEAKSLDIAAYMKGQLAEAAAIKEEEKRLRERRQRCERKAERLKRYLAVHIPPGTRYADSRSQISWRKSEYVDLDEEKVPHDFGRTTWLPDKVAIKAALKRGEDVPGATLDTRTNLQVR